MSIRTSEQEQSGEPEEPSAGAEVLTAGDPNGPPLNPLQPARREPNQLVFGDLTDYPVMAQALDNQWLPAELASSRQHPDAVSGPSPETVAAAAGELRRSLVNSGTLVVNRAFILNNEALYSSYLPTADPLERGAFAKLLNSRALVPFLFAERTATTDFAWGYDRQVHTAWSRLLEEEADPSLVRFDWDDARNGPTTARIGNWFSQQLSVLKRLDAAELASSLGISIAQAQAMRDGILRDLYIWAGDQDNNQSITRNAVYQRFLSRPGTEPYENLLLDGPHIVPFKQLIDLLYNLGVPLASGLMALTPPDSPPRSALQELRRENPRENDPEAIGLLLRALLADDLHRAVDGPNSYAGLGLADVVLLRREEEWRAYINTLSAFLDGSFADGRLPSKEEFTAGTREVARRHARMLQVTRRLSSSDTGFRREIATVLVLESAGIAMEVLAGETPSVPEAALALLVATAGPLTIRLQFRDRGGARGLGRGLSHSMTFPALRLGSLQRDWTTILRALGAEVTPTDRHPGGPGRLADRQTD
ncbi:hypothetical protein OG914_09770 [Streptomyces sp. NBC_00291]|uniref:hypothetical protein n=1 Tax=Streptomyces sp. NBC_00291 TaxID=2975704 RepID=UPI002255A5CC|nr:hypothetical protein [Streptomyces sp. NBC_00291]MCX5154272.1 hypothetical protein [Streptomyces sp. NBC_00291]